MLTQENKFLGKNLNSFYENKKQYALKKKQKNLLLFSNLYYIKKYLFCERY